MSKRQSLPLKTAYEFAKRNGLEREARAIRDMNIEWELSYGSGVRRAYLLALFENRGLLGKFNKENWPVGDTPGGMREREWCLTLRRRYEDFLADRSLELGESSRQS